MCSVDKLYLEVDILQGEVRRSLPDVLHPVIDKIFSDYSSFFVDEIISQWRLEQRYDELIDYIHYQFQSGGGDELISQILLDLRLKNDGERISRLLLGLYNSRMVTFSEVFKKEARHPDNYLLKASAASKKGNLMNLLYEYSFFLENKKVGERDEKLIEKNKIRIINLT